MFNVLSNTNAQEHCVLQLLHTYRLVRRQPVWCKAMMVHTKSCIGMTGMSLARQGKRDKCRQFCLHQYARYSWGYLDNCARIIRSRNLSPYSDGTDVNFVSPNEKYCVCGDDLPNNFMACPERCTKSPGISKVLFPRVACSLQVQTLT